MPLPGLCRVCRGRRGVGDTNGLRGVGEARASDTVPALSCPCLRARPYSPPPCCCIFRSATIKCTHAARPLKAPSALSCSLHSTNPKSKTTIPQTVTHRTHALYDLDWVQQTSRLGSISGILASGSMNGSASDVGLPGPLKAMPPGAPANPADSLV